MQTDDGFAVDLQGSRAGAARAGTRGEVVRRRTVRSGRKTSSSVASSKSREDERFAGARQVEGSGSQRDRPRAIHVRGWLESCSVSTAPVDEVEALGFCSCEVRSASTRSASDETCDRAGSERVGACSHLSTTTRPIHRAIEPRAWRGVGLLGHGLTSGSGFPGFRLRRRTRPEAPSRGSTVGGRFARLRSPWRVSTASRWRLHSPHRNELNSWRSYAACSES